MDGLLSLMFAVYRERPSGKNAFDDFAALIASSVSQGGKVIGSLGDLSIFF